MTFSFKTILLLHIPAMICYTTNSFENDGTSIHCTTRVHAKHKFVSDPGSQTINAHERSTCWIGFSARLILNKYSCYHWALCAQDRLLECFESGKDTISRNSSGHCPWQLRYIDPETPGLADSSIFCLHINGRKILTLMNDTRKLTIRKSSFLK